MTHATTLPCPVCSGTGTDTHEDRHTETNRDTCRTCGGTGKIAARTGESPEASFRADPMTTQLTEAGQKLAEAVAHVTDNAEWMEYEDLTERDVVALNTAAQILLTPEGDGGLREADETRRANYAEGRRQHWQHEAERLAWMVRHLGGDPEDTLTPTAAPKTSVPGNDAGMREAFEAWIKGFGFPTHKRLGGYENSHTVMCWNAWQAAHKNAALAALAPQPPKAETPAGVACEAVEAASAAFYNTMIGPEREFFPHHEGWAGKDKAFKAKVRSRMRTALEAAFSLAPSARAGDGVEREITTLLAEKKPSIESSGDFVGVTFDLSGEARQFAHLLAKAALSPPTGSAGDDETGVREAVRERIIGELMSAAWAIGTAPSEAQMSRLHNACEGACVALRAPQPPKAETPAGVGEDEAFRAWFERTSLGQGDRGFAASCFHAGYRAILSLAPAARDGDGVDCPHCGMAGDLVKANNCGHPGDGCPLYDAALTAAPAANGEGA